MENFIREYNDIIPLDLCTQIIKKFNGDASKKPGVTIGGLSDYKTSVDLGIVHIDWKDINDNINTVLSNAHSIYFDEFKFMKNSISRKVKNSNYNIQHYIANSGKYKAHVDSGCYLTGLRFLTSILYLNDVEEGGETSFIVQKKLIKPEQGKILVFPSSWPWLHEGKIPISNDKYIITTFLTYRT